jgi:glycosyltransferase involved in cell wall biosynthesis
MSEASKKARKLPFVSVIIPVLNDEQGISDTLDSVSKQDYPRDRWEVIVVDNNSTDNTTLVARSFADILPCLKIEKEIEKSSYAARNRGIQVSKGAILAFIDTDMTVNRDWIRKGATDLMEKEIDYLGCRVEIYTKKRKPNTWEVYHQRTGFPIKVYMEKDGFAGAGCIFVRKAVFEEIGLFDDRLKSNGDREFGNRVRDAGFRMYYSHDNVMWHPARSSLFSLYKKIVRTSTGWFNLHLLYPDRYERVGFVRAILRLKPPRPLDPRFHGLSAAKKLRLTGVKYFLHYVHAVTVLKKYFQTRLKRSVPGGRPL